jgi:predicted RecB family nuclease
MLVTDEQFLAYLQCETKSYLKGSGAVGTDCEFSDWQTQVAERFRAECCTTLSSELQGEAFLSNAPFSQFVGDTKCCLVTNCLVKSQTVQSVVHALARVTASEATHQSSYVPIRFIPHEKIAKNDKLLLAFDALALNEVSGRIPTFGRIICGNGTKPVRVKMAPLIETVKSIVGKIRAQQENPTLPQLILNKHCVECEFRTQCHQTAVEKDELSLLSSMSSKERRRHHANGIFTVTQLSYTFRARRKPKRFASKPDKYSHALKALAIREHKIYVSGKPELKITGNPVYLDVEGISDHDFYYLIGFGIKSGDSYVQHSFWADNMLEEKKIWTSFLQVLSKIENPQLIYYGSYETQFLKRMKKRYPDPTEDSAFLARLIENSINILSIIYAQIYFPTYSNGLKDIARYLGFQWSESAASGFNALSWRIKWEHGSDSALKQKLIEYNTEDCEALERVASTVKQLCQKPVSVAPSKDEDVVLTETIKRELPFRFGKHDFAISEFEQINRSAYWDYQRDRIRVRASQRLGSIVRKENKQDGTVLSVDQIVECSPPKCCPKCAATRFRDHDKGTKIVYGLKLDQMGVRRWITRFKFKRYFCYTCSYVFSLQKPWTRSKYDWDLVVYLVYQIIELQIPQSTVAKSFNQLFRLNLSRGTLVGLKSSAANFYMDSYHAILEKIVTGKLAHVDETPTDIHGRRAYVWVLTNLEEVIYLLAETREGDVIQSLLKDFKGVLVSDFYAVYDSIDCPQQKCLIHLMRDMNEDICGNPFDGELKKLAKEFAELLTPIIETIDRFGLRAGFLVRHKTFVDCFYAQLAKRDFSSEVAAKYKKRFQKHQNKLFTFLDYDDVPWNNNNAEYAIKTFARLRRVLGGAGSEKGIRDYLTLLSISQTCKYKGVSFLDFLRSGEKDVDMFIQKNNGVSEEI